MLLFLHERRRGCAIGRRYAAATHLLIAKFKRGKLKGSYGADSTHDQRGGGACFPKRKREGLAKGWEKEKGVLG